MAEHPSSERSGARGHGVVWARWIESSVYEELREQAAIAFKRERDGHTLQPTAVVNEALARLLGSGSLDLESRTHFLAVAARAMRRVLIDHARERDALKRGGGLARRVTLTDAGGVAAAPVVDASAVEEALQRLAALSDREARIVEMRFYAGMSEKEIAEMLGVSERTVRGDWAHARAWLRRELEEDPR